MIQALLLLQAALTLLLTVSSAPVTPEFKSQAITLANYAITIANEEILKSQQSSEPIIEHIGLPAEPIIQSSQQQSSSLSNNQINTSMSSIEIINPIAGKGLGRQYKSQPEVIDESNYIELGLIVRNDNGMPIKDAVVTITATDTTQNKAYNGTGNVYPKYENNVRMIIPYYRFHYEFKTAGEHTITFSANGLTDSVILTVLE